MTDTQLPLLTMAGIDKRFGATHALKGVNLTLNRGEVLGLIGENGAGKSTIIKILSGAYRKDGGTITLNGAVTDIGDPRTSQQLGISTIYQELTLFPDLDAVENILIGRERFLGGGKPTLISPLDRHAMRDAARRVLTEDLGVAIDVDLPVRKLNLAEKQLVEIARSLYSEAQIIIMDEPTEALEAAERERLFAIIDRLRSRGRAVIYVSHLLDELLTVADRVMVMRDGANVATEPVADVSVDRIINLMIGRELGQKYADKAAPTDEVALQVAHLTRPGKFKNVSFDLQRGEILGIAGLDGAGKKELVRAIFGADRYESGTIMLGGRPVHADRIRENSRAGIGLLPGDRKTEGLFLDKSVEWNITLAKLVKGDRTNLQFGALRDIANRFVGSMSIKARDTTQLVGDLSGGNQQKALLARWLATEPQVLILEEPTRGVDINSKAEIYRQITAAAATGTSFIVVSADSPELLGLCHRVLVMHSGFVAADLDASTSTAEDIAHYSVQTTGA